MGLLSSFAQSAGGLLAPPPVQPANPQLAALIASLTQAQAGSSDTSGVGSFGSAYAAPFAQAAQTAPQLPDAPIEQPQMAQSQMPPVQQGAPWHHNLIGDIGSAMGGLLGMPASQGATQQQGAQDGLLTPPKPYTPIGGIPGVLDQLLLRGAAGAIRKGQYNAQTAAYQQQASMQYLTDIASKHGLAAAHMAVADPKRFEDIYGYHNNPAGTTYTGQDGDMHIAPQLTTDAHGNQTLLNDAGVNTSPRQLPGGKTVAPSGDVLDDNLGLTDQSVSLPQKYAPGEVPATFNARNYGASGPSRAGGGAFGASPFGPAPPQLPDPSSDLPPPPAPPVDAPRTAAAGGSLSASQSSALSQNPAAVFTKILGAPVRVNSAVRTPGHNAAVGGSPTSEHMAGNGQAYDIQLPPGMKHAQAIAMIRKAGLPVDQFGVDGGALHVGFKPPGISGRNAIIGAPQPSIAANAPRKGQPGFSGVTAGQPVGGGFKLVSGSQVPGGDPNLTYKIAPNGDPTPMAKAFTMENVQGNRKTFYESPQYKAASESVAPIQALFRTVDTVAPGGVVGMAALDTLNKSLNPGGVVRPQTVQLFLDHIGLPEEIKSHISGIVGNGPLSPEVIKQIGRTAWQYGKAHIDQASLRASTDTALAVRNGYTADQADEAAPQMPPVPKWAQDGRPDHLIVGRTYWGANGPGRWDGKHMVLQ